MKHYSHNRLCRGCNRRRALFRFRGVVRADRDHDLCFRCYRSVCDALRPSLSGLQHLPSVGAQRVAAR
jgi:hypothetical protein